MASVAWGVGTLLDAALRWVMAYTLPIDVVPAISIALYAVTTIVLFTGTNVYYVLAGAMWWNSPLYDAPGTVRTTGSRKPGRPRRPRPRSEDRQSTQRQNGCPAGSRNTRKVVPG